MGEGSILFVLFGFLGTMVTGAASIVVAIIINRREKHDSAESSAEKLDEKWRAFKDEQISVLRQEKADLILKLADKTAECDRYKQYLDEVRAEEGRRIE